MSKAVITIQQKNGKLDVRVEFTPAANAKKPMTSAQSAAMAALKAIQEWAGGAS